MKRKALGKGLRSLIPEAPPPQATSRPRASEGLGLHQIDIDRIRPNRSQPRGHFDQKQLQELADSLNSQGVLQPVLVRPLDDGGFELIAGERRWRAAQMAGLLKIPAIVRLAADEELLELALVENLQREELSPIEEAAAYQSLTDLGLSQQDVALRVGKQRTTVANSIRLLNLPLQIQERITKGELSAGHARPLLALVRSKEQLALAERIVAEGLSVRQVESIVNRALKSGASTPGAKPAKARDPNVEAAETQLQSALGTKVRIVQRASGGGRLEISFFSDEELERVFQVLLKAARAK